MALKHALSILMSRFSLTYKTLLYAMIVIMVFVLIGVVVLLPIIRPLVTGIDDTGFFQDLGRTFANIFKGEGDQKVIFADLSHDIVEIGELFSRNVLSLTLSVIWIAIVIMLFKIVMTMCHYPIADVLNNFMAYNSRFGFTSNFVSNLGISAKYALSEFIVSIPYYLVTFGVVFGIAYLVAQFSGLLAAVIIFAALILLVAIKKALLCFWLPHLIYTKGKVWQCFKEQFVFLKEKFVKIFGLFVMTNLLMCAFVMFFGLFTLSIGWFVGFAMCVVLSRAIDLVIYYRHMDHKYYIEPKTVIDAKSEIM